MHSERRHHPRYLVDFKLKLTSDHQNHSITAVNLSAAGFQVICDDDCAEQLSKGQQHPLTCQLTIELPHNKLSINCRIIVKRRLSQCRYILGIKFINLSNDDCELLINSFR